MFSFKWYHSAWFCSSDVTLAEIDWAHFITVKVIAFGKRFFDSFSFLLAKWEVFLWSQKNRTENTKRCTLNYVYLRQHHNWKQKRYLILTISHWSKVINKCHARYHLRLGLPSTLVSLLRYIWNTRGSVLSHYLTPWGEFKVRSKRQACQ